MVGIRGCTGTRGLVRQLCQWMFLLSVMTPPGFSLNSNKKQVHVVVSEDEFEARDHWEAVLKCNIVFDNIPETGCSDIWWTHETHTQTHEEESVVDDDTYHVETEVFKHSSTLEIHRVTNNYSGAYTCHAKCKSGDFEAKCIVLNHVSTDGTKICSREDFASVGESSGFSTGDKFAVIGSLLGAAIIIIVIAVTRHLWHIRKVRRQQLLLRSLKAASNEDDDEINWTEMQTLPLQPRNKTSLTEDLHYEDSSRCVEGCGQAHCNHPRMRLPSYHEAVETKPSHANRPCSTELEAPGASDLKRKAKLAQIWKLMQSLKDENQPELASSHPPNYDEMLAMVDNLECAADDTGSSGTETDTDTSDK